MRNVLVLFTAFLLFSVLLPAGAAADSDKEIEKEFRIYSTSAGGDGYLGVFLRDITAEDVEKFGLKEERGAFVVDVAEGSPAEDAGLETSDVVIGYQSQPVLSVRQFQRIVGETPPGRAVTLEVVRNGEVIDMNAVIGEKENRSISRWFQGPSAPPAEGPRIFRFPGGKGGEWVDRIHEFVPWIDGGRPVLGIEGASMTDQMADYMGINQGEGVLVTAVLEDTPAEEAGLKAGDVITSVDGKEIGDLGDLRAGLKEGKLEMEVVRKKQSMVLEVEIKRPETRKSTRETIRM